jgi:outer membrane lipoprotein LolB
VSALRAAQDVTVRALAAARSLALCLAFAGCASLPPPAAPLAGDAQFSGRLALRVEAHGAEPAQSFASAFELQGQAERGQFDLNSALGTVLARARWEPGRATLMTPTQQSEFASLDALTEAILGQALPVAALFDWLAGRPWSGAPSQATAEGFMQRGWAVSTMRLAEGLLSARREQAPAVNLTARLDRPAP